MQTDDDRRRRFTEAMVLAALGEPHWSMVQFAHPSPRAMYVPEWAGSFAEPGTPVFHPVEIHTFVHVKDRAVREALIRAEVRRLTDDCPAMMAASKGGSYR